MGIEKRGLCYVRSYVGVSLRSIKPTFLHHLCSDAIISHLHLDVQKSAFPNRIHLQCALLKYGVVLSKLIQRGDYRATTVMEEDLASKKPVELHAG